MISSPSATVTLLFTDIEGSTSLIRALGEDRYSELLAQHHRVLTEAFGAAGGTVLELTGDGLYARFPSARDALLATVAGQRALAEQTWPGDVAVRVRMGLHTGEPVSAETGLVGIDVHRTARIAAAGHGGQILISQTTRDLVGSRLPPGMSLRDLGEHSLKDMGGPSRLYQVVAEGLAAEFPPLRTVDARPNNLPRHLSTFVGREREVAAAKRILDTAPIVTFTGPGGVGKTRLALEVGTELIERFEDGVWIVELATLTDPDFVVQAIAAALGLGEQPGRPLLATIADYLITRRTLLILDNCEHVLGAAAVAAHTLLRSCPSTRVIATSLEPLGIEGETTLPVGSLSVPEATQVRSGEAILESGAGRLFAERAGAALPTFQVTDRNAEAIARICSRLDGIPLAIELAAARVRALPVDQIAARLDDRFRLLTGGSRIAVPRHQTLRATMDWSYDLLYEEERAVLRRLSVFAGGFSLEAAEAVCAGETIDSSAVLDLVTHLVDKSLIVAAEPSDETDGEARFRLLETVRAYGWEQAVAAGESEEARRRHRDWYLSLADRTAAAFFAGPEPQRGIRILERDHDNLRAALEWSTATPGEEVAGLVLAGGLWRFWELRSYLAEGRAWLDRVLAATAGVDSLLRANALTGAGILAFVQGDYAAAFALHEESLALHRRLGSPTAISFASNNLANTAVQLGDLTLARNLYEEALANRRESGDARAVAFSLMNLADVLGRQGDFDGARERFDECIAIFRKHGDSWGIALALDNLGLVAARSGDVALARSLHDQALAVSRDIGDERGAARVLSHLGDVAAMEGDLTAARAFHRENLAIRRAVGDLSGIAAALEKLAWVMSAEEAEAAARLVGCAEALRSAIRAPVPPSLRDDHERHLRDLETSLGSRFEVVRLEGRAMDPEAAVATLLP